MKTKQTILEALVFVGLAGTVGLAFNAYRSQGLDIGRDYFPAVRVSNETPDLDGGPPSGVGAPSSAGNQPPEHVYQTVTLEQAKAYHDQADSSIVFIDARDDEHYQGCRISNAIQFDYYRPEQYIDDVLAFAEDAEVVIIYCNGGDCQDSLQTARYLIEEIATPLPFESVYVFEGGIQAWYRSGYEREPEDCEP